MIFEGYPGGSQAEGTGSGEGDRVLRGPYITDHLTQIADLQTPKSWYQTGKLTIAEDNKLTVVSSYEQDWRYANSEQDWRHANIRWQVAGPQFKYLCGLIY